MRDQVRDRLALSRAGWASHDQALPGDDRVDRVVLRRIRVEHQVLISERHPVGIGYQRFRRSVVLANQLASRWVAGNGCDEVMGYQLVEGAFQVLDHRKFRVAERAQDKPRRNVEAGHPGGLLSQPRVGVIELGGRVDHPVHPIEQRFEIDIAAELGLQVVAKRRIDLHVATGESDLEVVLGCAARAHARPAEEDRGGGRSRASSVLPRSQPAGEKQSFQTALFVVFARLVVNRAGPLERIRARVRIRENARKRDRLANKEISHRPGLSILKIEGAGPQVAVEEQVVAPAEIDQLSRPRPHRPSDCLDTLVREANARLFIDDADRIR